MSSDDKGWSFFTNHGHVLVVLYRNPDLRQRDIAAEVGITEGAVQRILTELQACGYIITERKGRRNHYIVDPSLGLRHRVEQGHTIGEILERVAPVNPKTLDIGAHAGAPPKRENAA